MKCPNCNEKMIIDDIENRFPGNRDVYGYCEHCLNDFVIYIRYGSIWKYDMCKIHFDKDIDSYIEDYDETRKTIYVYKNDKKVT